MGFHTLALDTSSTRGALALLAYEEAIGARTWEAGGKHAERALAELGLLLEQVGLGPASFDLLVAGLGPGSFTGVRVGLATLKGLALARSTPLVGVPSSEAIAIGARHAGPPHGPDHVAVVINAFKGEVFGCLYRVDRTELETLVPPTHGAPDAIAELLQDSAPGEFFAVGGGLGMYPDAFDGVGVRLPAACDVPDAHWLARAGLAKFERTQADELLTLEPAYVRGADAALPQKPLRLE